MLYFAYGSNMSTPRLRMRVPSAEPLGMATLAEHRLAFHKAGSDGTAKCDALHTGSAADVVIGVVFRMQPNHKSALDSVEGLGHGYQEKHVDLVLPGGEALTAFTYYATLIDAALSPLDWYRLHVLMGAREHGLPEDYVRHIEEVCVLADSNAGRRLSELAIYDEAGSLS